MDRAVRTIPSTRVIAIAALVLALASSPVSSDQGVQVAEPTGDGSFEGTWIYVNRDLQMALWLRQGGDGAPEAKLRYRSLAGPETFETDWTGQAEYYLSGQPATFAFVLEDGDRDRARGTWNWNIEFPSSARREDGAFTMYRGLDGRRLVLLFDRFERRVRRGEDVKTWTPERHAVTFVKASKRLVLWEELPF